MTFQHTIDTAGARLRGIRGLFLVSLAIAFCFYPSKSGAQIKSNAASVNLNAILNSGLTITAAPGLVNFNLVRNGTATGSAPVTITTRWTLTLFFANIAEYAYFTNSAAALTDGAGDNIPSSSAAGSFNGGAFAAFTGTSPLAAGSSITLFNQFIFFSFGGTRTDTLNLQINTTGLSLPAGTYTGVLHIQAQAN